MGWEDCHLHEFVLNQKRYETPDPDCDGPVEVFRDAVVGLATALPRLGSEMLYIYHFGDYWQHDIKLEAVSPQELGVRYPSCRAHGAALLKIAAEPLVAPISLRFSLTRPMKNSITCVHGPGALQC